MSKTVKRLWIGVLILILLTPIGLILPELFKAGVAWGEWGIEEIEKMIGYIPDGMKRLSELWRPLMPDYSFSGEEGRSLMLQSIAYIFSAILGIIGVVVIVYLLGRLLIPKK